VKEEYLLAIRITRKVIECGKVVAATEGGRVGIVGGGDGNDGGRTKQKRNDGGEWYTK